MVEELEIRDLVARYADAVTRCDLAAWSATWAEDGEWKLLGATHRGRQAVLGRLEELLAGLDFVAQICSGGLIEIDGEVARGRWTVTEHGRFKSGDPVFTLGLYKDDYVKEAGGWCFFRRTFHALYIGPPDMSAKFYPVPPDF